MSTITRIAVHGSTAVVVLLGATTVPATAQEESPKPDRDRECICIGEGALAWSGDMPHHGVFERRAMLGVTLDADSEAGLRIEGVTTDGPAEKAGLRAGDVITAIDDLDMAGMEADEAYEALVEYLAEEIEPGDTVEVAYDRDGAAGLASVETTAHSGVFAFSGPGGVVRVRPGGVLRIEPHMERLERLFERPDAPMPPRVAVRPGDPTVVLERIAGDFGRGARLVDVNEELGRYFDTDRGVLVVDVDEESALGLRPGDVILSIDGRDVEDAAHARRILGSYRAGEAVEFELMRDRRRTTVTGEAS